jgi:lipopolysaccharide export system protein LptC
VRDRAPTSKPDRRDTARQAAFRRAMNHSRRVRVLKLALPAAALAIAAGFIGYSYISVPGSVSFDVSESAYANGKLVMANPQLDGYTKENRPYSMSATRALQHTDNTSVVELEGIDAKVPVGAEKIAMIGAEHGVYNREKNTLNIPTAITVKTNDGTSVLLKSAYLDMLKGLLRTKEPVSITMAGVHLEANSMHVLENGHVLVFDKNVKMRLDPSRFGGEKGDRHEGTEQNVQD